MISEDLQTRENGLLTRLTELEAEAGKHRSVLDQVDEEISSVLIALNGVREDILDEFLTDYLLPKLITYTINIESSGEITLHLSPIAGGEIEFDRLKSQIGWADMNAVPLIYVLAYLGEGSPFGAGEGFNVA